MMKYSLLFVLCLSLSSALLSQVALDKNRFLEAGAMFGLTNYSGDMTEKVITFSESKAGFGFFARYHLSPNFALRAHIYSGAISGDDKHTSRADRQLRFGASLFETGLVGEVFLMKTNRNNGMGVFRPTFTPYIFGGVGYTSVSAEPEYYGDPANANVLKYYPLPEPDIQTDFFLAPVGLGVRGMVTEVISVGLEGGFRPVFSDDLDGIHINGNPNKNDWYYFAGLTVSFILKGQRG